MLKKNDLINVEINSVTNEGNGICHHQGFCLFVPHSAPGDKVLARVLKTNKTYGYAKIESLITPSPHRIAPDCPVHASCGGCGLRHVSYEAECEIKNRWAQDNMSRIGGINVKFEPFCPSPSINAYRNKALFPVALRNGRIITGFYRKNSHAVIENAGCRLHPAFFSDIANTVIEFCDNFGVKPYDGASHNGLLRHIYIRYAEATGQTMVCLVLNGRSLPHSNELTRLLISKHPQITSIFLNINRKKTNVILGDELIKLHGENYIVDMLCGVKNESLPAAEAAGYWASRNAPIGGGLDPDCVERLLRVRGTGGASVTLVKISPLSFYQVNRSCAEVLYGIAKDFAGLSGSQLLLDLYCGAGTIGLSMADRTKKIIGCDIVPDAIDDAIQNAKINGITNASFLCGDAGITSRTLQETRERPGVVVLDPPRKGCDTLTIDAVCNMSPDRIVMISCNTATLARDCKAFAERGYVVTRARAVDMFPRTLNVEAVVKLEKHRSSP